MQKQLNFNNQLINYIKLNQMSTADKIKLHEKCIRILELIIQKQRNLDYNLSQRVKFNKIPLNTRWVNAAWYNERQMNERIETDIKIIVRLNQYHSNQLSKLIKL